MGCRPAAERRHIDRLAGQQPDHVAPARRRCHRGADDRLCLPNASPPSSGAVLSRWCWLMAAPAPHRSPRLPATWPFCPVAVGGRAPRFVDAQAATDAWATRKQRLRVASRADRAP